MDQDPGEARIFSLGGKMNKAAQALGRLGGKAGTGKAKARTKSQARAAAKARWAKARALRQNS